MIQKWHKIKRHSYLLIASGVILLAILALLFMQYQSIRQTQKQAQATLKANLELHLFEITENAKRDLKDHANHILHGIRQKRVRERQTHILENIFNGLTLRYPEVDEYYVVFFEAGKELETWKTLTYVPYDKSEPNPNTYKGKPIGRLVEKQENSESILRAWQSIKKQNMTKLYSAYDPQTKDKSNSRQYFIHTVFEAGTSKPDNERRRVGLLAFSANPQKFPSKNYFSEVVAKYENRNNQNNNLNKSFSYEISYSKDKKSLFEKDINKNVINSVTKSFDSTDKLFPNLSFTVTANQKEAKTFLNEYFQSNIFVDIFLKQRFFIFRI